jgi:hypothetical protein
MTDTPIDAQTLKDLPQGALETLLSTARAETGAAVAFVALYRADGSFAITTSMEEEAAWEGRSLASLARSIWLDPDLSVGKVLVSSARVESGRIKRRQAQVASVVLSDSATSDLEWGLLSIIAHTDRQFSEEQVGRITALSGNLAAYLSARERMINDLMDVVHDEMAKEPASSTVDGQEEPALEDLIIQTVGDEAVGPPAAPRDEEEFSSDTQAPPDGADGQEGITTPRTWVIDDGMQSEIDQLGVHGGNNGANEVPVRTVGDEPEDEVHVLPTQPVNEIPSPARDQPGKPGKGSKRPKVVRNEDISPEVEEPDVDEADEEPSEPRAPELTMQVVDPGLIAHIGDAMDSIGDSVESVVLIHLRISYEDTAAIVPTEAARVLVAKSTKECVRYDDYVARVGENSFVVVARLRPGSPRPSFIEKRLLKAARKATGWSDSGPTFRTEHLVVEPDGIDDPEDVLLALLHG